MKYSFFILILITGFSKIWAQSQKEISMTSEQIEAVFIEQNLELIAEKMNISLADAAIKQAKLWDNPSISVNDLNFWTPQSKRDGEDIPALFGSFAKNTQFTAELSQIISVSGRRAKLADMERVSKEMAMVQFEELLRSLKLELRTTIADMMFMQDYKKILDRQNEILQSLIISYQKQYNNGNISKNELIRLQASLLELENELNEIETEISAGQKNLKNLLSAEPFITINIEDQNTEYPSPDNMNLLTLTETGVENRTDVTLSKLETKYFQKSIKYEKSLRMPDLNLSASYDRRGGVWRDYIGVGIGIDIPMFNRNQGAVKIAQISKKQSEYNRTQQEVMAKNDIAEAYGNYVRIYNMYDRNINNPVLSELDMMLNSYSKNLVSRNISMVEFMDFMDTYRNTKQMILTTRKNMTIQFEELKYTVGTEKF